jgi:hypothetical protein
LEEVKTRLTEELRLRTEERVRHWDRLSDWCRQRPGLYIGVDWRSGLRSSSGIRVGEATAGVTGAGIADGIGSSSSTTSTTNNIAHVRSGIDTEELDFQSGAGVGDEALNDFWDLWDIQRELQDLIEVENIEEKSVVEQPD